MSIDNTYNANDLREFDRSVRRVLGTEPYTYVVELKIDGVAMTDSTDVTARIGNAAPGTMRVIHCIITGNISRIDARGR